MSPEKNPSTTLSRRKQREIVMKSLYMREIRNEEIPLDTFILSALQSVAPNKRYKNRESLHHATHLLHTSIAHEEHIISIIRKVLKNEKKTIKDLLLIDKCIMLMSIAEMSYYDTDHGISINEAIELSKQYSTDYSFKFINGVLDVYRQSLASISGSESGSGKKNNTLWNK